MSYSGPLQPLEQDGLYARNLSAPFQLDPSFAAQLLQLAPGSGSTQPGSGTPSERGHQRQYQSASGTPGDSWRPTQVTALDARLNDMSFAQQQQQLYAMHSLKQEQQDQQLGGLYSHRHPPSPPARHTMDGSMHMWGQQPTQSRAFEPMASNGSSLLPVYHSMDHLAPPQGSGAGSRLSEPGKGHASMWQAPQTTASRFPSGALKDENSSESGSAGGSTLRHGQHLLAGKDQSAFQSPGAPSAAMLGSHMQASARQAQLPQRAARGGQQQQQALQTLKLQIEQHQLQLRAKNSTSTGDPTAAQGSASQTSPGAERQPISHSNVEKQRRDRINTLIDELRMLVPPMSSDELGMVRRAKHAVLADTILMIRNIQDTLPALAEAMVSEQGTLANGTAPPHVSRSQSSAALGSTNAHSAGVQAHAKLGLSVIQEPGGLCVQVLCRTRPVSDVIKALSVLPIEVVAVTSDGKEEGVGGEVI